MANEEITVEVLEEFEGLGFEGHSFEETFKAVGLKNKALAEDESLLMAYNMGVDRGEQMAYEATTTAEETELQIVVTAELLEDLECYAQDHYTLPEAMKELNVSLALLQDEQVQRAFERGLTKQYIMSIVTGDSYDDIIASYPISLEKCEKWAELYKDEIEDGKAKRKEKLDHATEQFSNLTYSSLVNILYQNGPGKQEEISQQKLKDDFTEIIERVKDGDTTDLLTILTSNLMQMQLFNGQVSGKITVKDISYKNYELLSRMQMKLLQESRKTVMCINEVVNPKRTTFVKNAEQHNHIHQNSEKNTQIENEKQNAAQLEQPDEVTETEIIPLKDRVK